ncbi:unnamed protein product [Clonostachys rosea]|uniref:Uncharacterized protein n=1 Tax=Bionectria ochroleuca TaxID=29856 RepID=A0ABY6U2N7_BIOOC|nr:unnamed protein product [Clonostachys rosea]
MKLSASQDGAAPVVTSAPDDFLAYTNANRLFDSHEIREYPRNALDGLFDSLLHLRQSSCDDGTTPCGSGCMPEGADCCNGKSYCDEGTECQGSGRCRTTSSSKTTSTTSSKSSSSAKPTSTSTTSTSAKPTSTSTTSSKTTSSSSTTSSKSSSTSSKTTSSSSSSSTEESTTTSSTSSEESTTASSTDSTTASATTDDGSSTTLSDSVAQIIRTAVPSAAQTDPESACFLATQYTSYYTTPDWYKSMPSNAQSYYSSSANIQASRTSFCTATALAGSDGSDSSDNKSGPPAGTIAGAIVGSLVGVALLAILIFWLFRSGKVKSPFARDLSAEEDPVMAYRGPLDGAGGGSSVPMQQSAYMPLVATPAAAAMPAAAAATRHQSQSYRSVSPESFVRSSQQGPMNFPVPPSLAAAGGVPYQKRMSSYDSGSERQYQPWPGHTPTVSMSGDTLNRGSVASQSVFNPPAAYGAAYGAAYLPKDPQPEPAVIPSPSPEPVDQIAPPASPPASPPIVAAVAPQLPALHLSSDEAAEVLPPPGPPPASAERVHEMEAAQPAANAPAISRKAVPSPAPRLD